MVSPQLLIAKQIAAKLEVVEGTSPGSFTAADALQRVIQPSIAVTPFEASRDFARASFTHPPKVLASDSGVQSARCQTTFGVELAGHSSGLGTAPLWSKYLKASGFREEQLKTLTIGAITNGDAVFLHGETVTGGTSTETATVVSDTHNGTTTLYIARDSGTFDVGGEVLTGSVSGCVATTTAASQVAAQGWGWWPVTIPTKKMTVSSGSATQAVGDILIGDTSGARARFVESALAADTSIYLRLLDGTFTDGEAVSSNGAGGGAYTATGGTPILAADHIPTLTFQAYMDGQIMGIVGNRGTVSFTFEHGKPAIANFDFQGVWASVSDGANLTLGTYPAKVPPVFRGAQFTLNDGTLSHANARFNSLAIDMASAAVVRDNSNKATGLQSCVIDGREPSLTFNPDKIDEAVYPFYDNWLNGTTARASWRLGSTSGNKIEFRAPATQFSGIAEGTRDQRQILDATAMLTGGLQVSSTVVGGDNELVLLLV